MKRRELIMLLGGAAAWPLAARAQQPEHIRRIGVLLTTQENDPATRGWLEAFQRRLQELGWTEDRSIHFERRWAEGHPARIRTYVAEIVSSAPDVIFAQSTPMVAALREQTESIPIVFVQFSDPVGDGFVETLAHPARNVTGFTNTMASLGGKWLELLREAAPMVSRVGYLLNRAAAPGGGAYYITPLLSAAAVLGLNAVSLELQDESEIDKVIADFAAAGGNGMVANSDFFITAHRDRIIAAANRLRLPTIYSSAMFTNSGGLLSYGADTEQQWQGAAGYVDRILRGEKPRDLPVQQPSKFVLAINLKTAKTIGLDVPWFLQQRADEVIE